MNRFNCVLLIDDDGIANFNNYRLIKKMNLTEKIETVMNGEKALYFIQHYAETNKNNCPELILLDLKMPVLDGINFLEYFTRKTFNNNDKILISILSDMTLDEKVIQKKFPRLGFIEKPLTEEKVNKLLNKQQRTQTMN